MQRARHQHRRQHRLKSDDRLSAESLAAARRSLAVSFSPELTSVRVAIQAGAIPKSSPVASVTNAVKAKIFQSKRSMN